jgi:hypothetical protein
MRSVIYTPAEFARRMAALPGRFIPAVRRGVLSGALRSLTVLDRRTRTARPANPRGVGVGGAVDKGGGGGFIAQWKAEATPQGAVVFNTAVYAPIIEWGRRLGAVQPPVKNIAIWAQRRLGLSLAEAKRAAFAISRAIRNRGLLPRLIMTDALPEMRAMVSLEIQAELDAEMRK